jgi:hypothetical protein
MRMGNKKIFHLEAWVVKVMALYKVRCNYVPMMMETHYHGVRQHFMLDIAFE